MMILVYKSVKKCDNSVIWAVEKEVYHPATYIIYHKEQLLANTGINYVVIFNLCITIPAYQSLYKPVYEPHGVTVKS